MLLLSLHVTHSEHYFYFDTGSVVANSKHGKKGSRGKKDRMTEAEEDAQLLKSAQSKRRIIRVDKQPSNLSPHCKMHPYQLEGLNWLIKLHDHGINGILADEVSFPFFRKAFALVSCCMHACRISIVCFQTTDGLG
jgi:SWI/SNF-related matrix-associated actin-dependent regulator of chromatin subfamily A member 5